MELDLKYIHLRLEKQRWDNPHKRKARAKHNAGQGTAKFINLPRNNVDAACIAVAEGAALAAAPKRTVVQMPDEYLPPNKILFLQNLPETATKIALTDLFSQYVISSPLLVHVFTQRWCSQIPEPGRSAYDSDEKGYCFRRICGRGELRCGQGCASQLQARRRAENQGTSHHAISARLLLHCSLVISQITFARK